MEGGTVAFCGNCGKTLGEREKFCGGCGARIPAVQPPGQQAASPSPQQSAVSAPPQYTRSAPRPPSGNRSRSKTFKLAAFAVAAVIVALFALAHFRVWPFNHIGGRLKIAPLTADQISGKAPVAKPDAEERQRFVNYTGKLKNHALARINRQDGAEASALAAIVAMQKNGEFLKGDTQADKDAFAARFKELSEGKEKISGSIFAPIRSWILATGIVFADDAPGASPAQDKYSATLLNNISNLLMLQGKFYNTIHEGFAIGSHKWSQRCIAFVSLPCGILTLRCQPFLKVIYTRRFR